MDDKVITEAAVALADSMTKDEVDEGRLYPKLGRVREISQYVAFRCIKVLIKDGLCRDDGITASMGDDELFRYVGDHMWEPHYEH